MFRMTLCCLFSSVSIISSAQAGNLLTLITPVLTAKHEGTLNSELAIAPDTVFTNASSDITVAITITEGRGNETVELWQTDNNGVLLQQVASLKDDGNAEAGDYLKGDGIYHGKFTVTPVENGKSYYQAVYNSQKSEIITTYNVPELTDSSLDAASAQADTAKSVYDNAIAGGSDPQGAQAAVQAMLANESNILQYGKADDNYGSWWVTSEGIVVVHDPLTEGGDVRGSSNRIAARVQAQQLRGRTPLLPRNEPALNYKTLHLSSATADKRVGSGDALLLEVYSFGGNENSHIESALTNYGMNVTAVSEGNVTLDNFKQLSKYGVLSVVSHGASYFGTLKSILFGLITWWDEEWGQLNVGGWPTISTPLVKTNVMKADIAAGRLAVSSSGKVSILPAFILHYNNNLPDSIVWMGICQGAYNDNLGNAFTVRGASAFFSFSDSVQSPFAQNHGEGLFDHLTQDKTAGTYAGIGQNDGDSNPAELRLIGDGNIKLIDPALLKNGDFESGTLNSWNPAGDVRVIQKLQALNAPQGTYMATLTTGVGAESDSTSTLNQKIKPSTEKHLLKFQYDFVSEEPLEWVNSSYDDRFELVVDGTNTTLLENVNNAEWKLLGGDYFQGGDETTYHTGWKERTIDLSNYIGSLVEIKFIVSDVGDSIYDSAALIDNIRLE